MSSLLSKQILSILKTTYPHAKIVLNYGNNWELLIAVVLSAQCTDKKVNEVTAVLFKKYTKVQIYKGTKSYRLPFQPKTDEDKEISNFATVPIEELEKDIKSTGFYHNKAKNIQGAARKIMENFGGKIPRTMEEMLTIPGVARKTANIVLGNAYGIISGIAVDTHVQRVTQRLRLVDIEKVGSGKKPIYFEKNVGSPHYASLLSWSTSMHRKGASTGFGRSSDFSLREKSGSSEKKDESVLDYYKDASPEKIEQKLMTVVPKKDWFKFTYWVIEHGRAICKAQKPRCEICPLQEFCPASRI